MNTQHRPIDDTAEKLRQNQRLLARYESMPLSSEDRIYLRLLRALLTGVQSDGIVVNPAHKDDAEQLLLNYFRAASSIRTRYAAIAMGALVIGLLAIMTGGHFMPPIAVLATTGGLWSVAALIGRRILGVPVGAPAARRAIERSRYFRSRDALDEYFITPAASEQAVWDAIELEERRSAIAGRITSIDAHRHLTSHRVNEIEQARQEEQQLRSQIVDMLDPLPKTTPRALAGDAGRPV